MEQIFWKVEFNTSLGQQTFVKWEVSDVFNACEQFYIFSFSAFCLLIYVSIAMRIKKNRQKLLGNQHFNVEERKILFQSVLFTTLVSAHRITILLMKFDLPNREIILSVWLIVLWLHHSLTPIICSFMSAEIRDLLFFKGKFVRRRNKVISGAKVLVRQIAKI